MTDESQQTRHTGPQRTIGGRYVITRELGRGGMGVVWHAEDTVIGRSVAIKELRLPDAGDGAEVFQERVLREVRTGGRLNDPAVVTVFDVINEGQVTYIVMELVEAPTLSDVVKQRGPLHPQQVAAVGEQVLTALTAAHQAGIVHRDVKPGNIMVAANGRVKLTDFGIAQAIDDPRLTTSGMLVGSPAFISPERVEGREATPAADIWSLGVTLYYAVEGKIAFDRGTTAASLHAIMTEVPYLTRAQGPLAAAIMGMLITSPEARIGAEQAQQLLGMAKAGTGVATPQSGHTAVYPGGQPSQLVSGPHRVPPRKASWGKRTAVIVGGVLAAVALLVGGAFLGAWITSPSVDDRLETLTYGEGGDIVDFDVDHGYCVNVPLDGRRSIDSGSTVTCDQGHEFEVFEVFGPFEGSEDISYPEAELKPAADTGCELVFRSDLIVPEMRDKVDYQVLVPSEQAWRVDPESGSGDREVYCVAMAKDGGRLVGSVIVQHDG